MRTSNDQYANGRIINGYDYANQAWVVNGKYINCGHPATMDCGCYGRAHAGEETTPVLCNCENSKCNHPAGCGKPAGNTRIQEIGLVCDVCAAAYPDEYHVKE